MPTDITGLGFSETNETLKPERSDIRRITRVSMIALSFHVFMGTCAVVIGLTWFELIAFSAESHFDLPWFRAFFIYTAIVGGIYLGSFLAWQLGVTQYQLGGLPEGTHIARANGTSKSEIPAAAVGAAILDGQIDFALQPIIDARTGEITATEALLRWYLDDGSVVPLADFLSTFVSLEWHPPYYQAINSTRLAILDGVREIKDIDVHFNFSVESLGLSRASKLNNVIRSDLRGFVVEISEKDSPSTFKNGIPHQDSLLSAGGKYALDDFGKGFSNLDRLSQLEIDLVKFDISLIKDITDNTRQRAAIKHVTALCEELDIGFIAEGVETVQQESTLLELGVFAHQGFLRGEPIKKSAFLNLLRSNTQLAKPTGGMDEQNFGDNGAVRSTLYDGSEKNVR